MDTGVIGRELRAHVPFTILGSLSGVLLILVVFYLQLPRSFSRRLFWSLHPTHVLLSALATTSMYRSHSDKSNLFKVVIIGYLGAIFIGTLSDSLIPYLGEFMLDLPNKEIHIGFIEKWWLVNPLAFAGIAIGMIWPQTEFPHAGHVLLSVYASLFHILMASGSTFSFTQLIVVTLFLFLAVWVPCCTSDIVFPLLFSGEVEHNH